MNPSHSAMATGERGGREGGRKEERNGGTEQRVVLKCAMEVRVDMER